MTEKKGKSASQRDEKEEINWIQCQSCAIWFEYQTTGLPMPFDEKQVKKIKYDCKLCLLTVQVQDLTAECTILKNRLTELEKIVEVASEKEVAMKEKLEQIPEQIDEVKISVQKVDEANEIEKRKFNLIVAGLPESDKDLDNLIEYMYAEKDCHINVPLEAADFASCERLGKWAGKPRLLRVKMKSSAKRRSLLVMRENTGDHSQKKEIYVRPDLTKAQQEKDRKLRQDLAVAGKDKFKIHRGCIVPREQPTNLMAAVVSDSGLLLAQSGYQVDFPKLTETSSHPTSAAKYTVDTSCSARTQAQTTSTKSGTIECSREIKHSPECSSPQDTAEVTSATPMDFCKSVLKSSVSIRVDGAKCIPSTADSHLVSGSVTNDSGPPHSSIGLAESDATKDLVIGYNARVVRYGSNIKLPDFLCRLMKSRWLAVCIVRTGALGTRLAVC